MRLRGGHGWSVGDCVLWVLCSLLFGSCAMGSVGITRELLRFLVAVTVWRGLRF